MEDKSAVSRPFFLFLVPVSKLNPAVVQQFLLNGLIFFSGQIINLRVFRQTLATLVTTVNFTVYGGALVM